MGEREYLISELLRRGKELGKMPCVEDMRAKYGYPAAHRYIKEFGSWINAKNISYNITATDPYFFSPENMNPRKWYIVGYIITDGNINDNGHANRLSITTTEKDKDNLYDLHKYMGLNTFVHVYEKGKVMHNDWQNSYTIHFNNKQWCDDLALYGIVPRKTGKEYIPLEYIKTKEEAAAICRGIFDGDGGVYFSKRWGFKPVFIIYGSEKLCEGYSYLLKKYCGLSCNVRKNRKIYQIRVEGLKCNKIYNFLYEHENFYIERKKNRFEKLVNNIFNEEEDYY